MAQPGGRPAQPEEWQIIGPGWEGPMAQPGGRPAQRATALYFLERGKPDGRRGLAPPHSLLGRKGWPRRPGTTGFPARGRTVCAFRGGGFLGGLARTDRSGIALRRRGGARAGVRSNGPVGAVRLRARQDRADPRAGAPSVPKRIAHDRPALVVGAGAHRAAEDSGCRSEDRASEQFAKHRQSPPLGTRKQGRFHQANPLDESRVGL